ncbi:MAG: LON peptidase substrate-binding domain-containing protein [Coraliomargaritaceae bacterium]
MMQKQEIEIPREVPVMTMGGMVLFPQAVMPLHIFEPRYREMLDEVLASDRIFAVAALDESNDGNKDKELPHLIAGIGVVRACRTNEDGTSNLVLQGLARVRLEAITAEQPFRKARIIQIQSEPGAPPNVIASIRDSVLDLIQALIRLGASIPREVPEFLSKVTDPETVLDLSIYSLCPSSGLKQELLETTEILLRYQRFEAFMHSEIERMRIENQLKGELDDDSIGMN